MDDKIWAIGMKNWIELRKGPRPIAQRSKGVKVIPAKTEADLTPGQRWYLQHDWEFSSTVRDIRNGMKERKLVFNTVIYKGAKVIGHVKRKAWPHFFPLRVPKNSCVDVTKFVNQRLMDRAWCRRNLNAGF